MKMKMNELMKMMLGLMRKAEVLLLSKKSEFKHNSKYCVSKER